MNINNPTDQDVTVIFEGVSFTVEAGGSLKVSEQLAEFWVGIHEFMTVTSEEVKEVKKAKEDKEESKK